jgi:hypothetical protein
MTKTVQLLFLVATILANGCTLTLNSLFTSKDVVYDPALEGIWQHAEATWTIKPFDKLTGEYFIQTKDQPQTESFYATLGTIGTNRFLELTPKRYSTTHPKSFYGGHFIRLHSFWGPSDFSV